MALKLKARHDDDNTDVTPNSPLWNNSNLQDKQNNLLMKNWIHKGIYQIKDILDDQNNLIPSQELENQVGRGPHRLLEYNAVNTTLQQARQHNRLHLSNNPSKEDSHNMTPNDTPVTSLSAKDIRQALTEDTQPCSVNFWRKRFDTEIDYRYWEVAFNAS